MVPKSRKNKILKFWIFIICIFILLIILLLGTDIFNVKQIVINGNSYYSKEDILKTSGISNGASILKVNKTTVKKEILKLPYIDSVDIETRIPDKVSITVKESEPIGYVPFSGTYLLIDKNGKVINQLINEDEDLSALPIILGINFERFTLGEILDVDDDTAIIASVEISTLLKKYGLINQKIKIDMNNTEQIRLYIDELDVIIGEMNHIDKKIQWLSEVITKYKIGVLDLSNVQNGQAVMSPLM